MFKGILRRALFLFALLLPAPMLWAAGPGVDLLDRHAHPLAEELLVYVESEQRPIPEQVLAWARQGQLAQASVRSINRGLGSDPLWLVMRAHNPTNEPLSRELSAEVGWLDQLELVHFFADQRLQEGLSGDRIGMDERPLPGRFPRFSLDFPPGESWVLLRAETQDPMMLPLFLSRPHETRERDRNAWLTYGFVYGAVASIAIYNLVLFFALGQLRFGLFSLYLVGFLFMNLSYSGIGMELFWPQAVVWQQWAPPLGMTVFVVSGLVFGAYFLSFRQHYPGRFRILLGACVLMPTLVLLSLIAGHQALALNFAFAFVPLFSLMMIGMGASAFRREPTVAALFLVGTMASIVTATVTALTVAGPLPYTALGFHAVEFGMVVDAVFLALALAEQVRTDRVAMRTAERAALQDPLTGLVNRRGFARTAEVLWTRACRLDLPLSVLTLDLDHFKRINDRFGHAAGDRVLERLAAILNEGRRQHDLIARMGGEEFVVILPECGQPEALIVAERYRQAVRGIAADVPEIIMPISVSIGVATRQPRHHALEALIKDSDQALYAAKRAGRDRVRVLAGATPAVAGADA